MKRKQVFVVAFILFLASIGNSSFRLFAQSLPPIHFTHYTTDDGLPHDIGYQIIQDKQGYLWVGTDNGLTRFDGYQFQTFDEEEGLGNPFPIDIAVSEKNELYIGTWGNGVFKKTADTIVHVPMRLTDLKISRINYKNEKIQFWTRSALTEKGFLGFTQREFDLQKKQLERVFFFGQKGGPYYIGTTTNSKHSKTLIFNYSQVDGNLKGKMFTEIAPSIQIRDSQEVYFTEQGLLIDNQSTAHAKSEFLRFSYSGYYENIDYLCETKLLRPFDKRIEGKMITTLTEGSDGDLWLGSTGKIYHFTADGHLKSYPLSSPNVSPYELTIWQNKYLVFFSHEDRSKLYLLEMKSGQIHEIGSHLELSTTVSDIYIDDEDNLWITTDGSGLYYLRPFLMQNYAKEAGLENSFIYEVVETKDGTLFTATKKGIFYFKGNNWIKLDDHNTNVDLHSGLEISNNGSIWLGGGNKYVNFLTKIEIPSLNIINITQEKVGRNFHLDSRNRIWSMEVLDQCLRHYQINHLDDLKQFYKKNGWGAGFSKSFLESFFAIQEIRHDRFSMLEVSDGNMLLGTSRGVFTMNTDTFDHFSKDNGLPSTVVNDIVKSEDGRIWIATEKGICTIEANGFVNIPTEGLMSLQCRKLLFDHNGQLWAGTPAGLHYFIPSEEI